MESQPKRWNDRDPGAPPFAPLAIVMLVFCLPTLANDGSSDVPDDAILPLALDWDLKIWTEIFSKPHYWTIMLRTVGMAVICVVISLLIAFPDSLMR